MARIATVDDWPEIEGLIRAMGFTEGQSAEEMGARFSEFVERTDHFICVVEHDGLVGYAWAQDFGPHLRSGRSVAKLHDLFVAESARRSGIGRDLFASALAWARERGSIRWLQWYAGASWVGFYAALGLEPTPTEDSVHPFYEIDFG